MLPRWSLTALLGFAIGSAAQGTPAPTVTFAETLKQIAAPITVRDGNITGPGAASLTADLAASRFVLIGEAHLSREIPLFTTAVCNLMHPDAYAVEAGPQAARFVQSQLSDPQRLAHMHAMLTQYPSSMAFLDVQQENDTAAACARSSHNAHFALWGLDQEFLGAAGALLESMGNTQPGPRTATALRAAQGKERLAETAARASGDVSKLHLVAATDEDMQKLTDAVNADGTPSTRLLLKSFAASRDIYRLNLANSPNSNRVRNLLMKQYFLSNYLPFRADTPDGRILLKMGAMHMGKGFSQLHQREIGNTIAELADVQQAQSLHIIILGVRGEQAQFGGYGKPNKVVPFDNATDKDEAWLAPAIAAMAPATPDGVAMTMLDLRKLRFRRKLPLSDEWQQVVYGYDLMVLIPQVTVATSLE